MIVRERFLIAIFLLAFLTSCHPVEGKPTNLEQTEIDVSRVLWITPNQISDDDPGSNISSNFTESAVEIIEVTELPQEFSFPFLQSPTGSIFVHSRDVGLYYYIDPLQPDLSWPDTIISSFRSSPSPGGATLLSFSNFADRLAYLDQDCRAWITDLSNKEQSDTGIQINCSNDPLEMIQAELIWTPDDQHLMVIEESGAWIYHIQTEKYEPWNFQCNQLAISPKTSRIAIWCQSTETALNHAIVEWGGDIWYSDALPENIFLTTFTPENQYRWQAFSLYSVAGWTFDGQKIAYFNPDDHQQLIILNATGDMEQRINYTGQLWAEIDFYVVDHPIKWSSDGKRLLLYVMEKQSNPCYSGEDKPLNGSGNLISCWHVIDPETGNIIWQPAFRDKQHYLIGDQATISADGMWLALANRMPSLNALLIVNLENFQVFVFPSRVSAFRWGSN